MSTVSRAKHALGGWLRALAIGYGCLALAFGTRYMINQDEIQQQQLEDMRIALETRDQIEQLESQSFEDYMIYYSILPRQSPVYYGDEAYWKSDAEIVSVPAGGLEVSWNEWIECDHNPYDGKPNFEYYAKVQSTSAVYLKTRKRPSQSVLRERRGYPSTASGSTVPVTYPLHDADCRLVSVMTQKHHHGIKKLLKAWGEIVEVRGTATSQHDNDSQ